MGSVFNTLLGCSKPNSHTRRPDFFERRCFGKPLEYNFLQILQFFLFWVLKWPEQANLSKSSSSVHYQQFVDKITSKNVKFLLGQFNTEPMIGGWIGAALLSTLQRNIDFKNQ